MTEYWYRAEDRRYANYDPWAEFEQPSGSHLQIQISRYQVERHSPRGVFLQGHGFVLGTAIRQWGVPTVELALRDLEARKERHVRGCEDRLARAQEHLKATSEALHRERTGGRMGYKVNIAFPR